MTKEHIITVVGVGALGSHLVQFIRNLNAKVVIIDYDRVEMKNTQSQLHGKPGVGKLKTDSLKQTMQFLFGTNMVTLPRKLVDNNVNELLKGATLVVDCLDNGAARRLVQGYARANNVPCVHGGLAADGSFGIVMWDENFKIDDEPEGGAATCEDGRFLPFIAIASAFLAKSVQSFIETGKKESFHVYPTGAKKI